ncbi:MAG: hypothetical protein ACKPKO_17985, partial [Candidatus Fonsibacter sp.]
MYAFKAQASTARNRRPTIRSWNARGTLAGNRHEREANLELVETTGMQTGRGTIKHTSKAIGEG